MSLGIVVIGLVLAAAVAAVALVPLVERKNTAPGDGPRGTPRQNQALAMLAAEKQRVLRALRDLDFDYDLGKLADDAYASQRNALLRLGVAILREIDTLHAAIAEQDARVEAAISAFRQRETADPLPEHTLES